MFFLCFTAQYKLNGVFRMSRTYICISVLKFVQWLAYLCGSCLLYVYFVKELQVGVETFCHQYLLVHELYSHFLLDSNTSLILV